MFFKVTAVCWNRFIVREPSLLSSQVLVCLSRTRQDAVKLPYLFKPPHTAVLGRGSAVVKSVCPYFTSANEGGLQPFVLGNISLEESRPSSLYPPVKRAMVSSLLGGGSVVVGPGCFVLV